MSVAKQVVRPSAKLLGFPSAVALKAAVLSVPINAKVLAGADVALVQDRRNPRRPYAMLMRTAAGDRFFMIVDDKLALMECKSLLNPSRNQQQPLFLVLA